MNIKKRGRFEKEIFLGVLFIFFLFNIFHFASAENLISYNDVRYDSNIPEILENKTLAERIINQTNFTNIEILNNKTWMRVIIELKDSSKVTGNETEILIKQKALKTNSTSLITICFYPALYTLPQRRLAA